ncbi:hypothetical protein HK099_002571 [Clydaea vesicula]|uniref:Uncharacterized protein n=1 Tax=Clydaea vesicula TaxID=447962 RepID=A0AAD5XVH3_9FUNG|nr:hypothetical protein HK099_002571 [Clydaea vesicula]
MISNATKALALSITSGVTIYTLCNLTPIQKSHSNLELRNVNSAASLGLVGCAALGYNALTNQPQKKQNGLGVREVRWLNHDSSDSQYLKERKWARDFCNPRF